MTLDKLNYLVTLAEEQNVTRAAQRLFITQPTLTAFVNKTEQQLGFRIFDRSRNPVVLTRSGRAYIDQMRRLLTEEIQLVESIREKEHAQPTIRIGIGQIHSQMWMPQLSSALLLRHPQINIHLREAQELQLMNLLRNDEIDLILGHLEIDTVNFHFEALCEEALSLIIPENLMPEAALDAVTSAGDGLSPRSPLLLRPEMLSDLPLICPARMQGLFLNLKQLLDHYHIHPKQILQTANMITAASMVQMGLGYMYLAPVLLQYTRVSRPLRLYFCTLPHLIASRKFYLGYKKENPNSALISEIREIIKTIITDAGPSSFQTASAV